MELVGSKSKTVINTKIRGDVKVMFDYKNEIITLPITPGEIEISGAGNNETASIVKLGDINIIKTPGLKEISFSGILPFENNYPFIKTKSNFKSYEFYIEYFNKIRKDKSSVKLLIVGLGIDVNVSIEDFNYKFEAGSEDVSFEISLKEYKNSAIKTISIVQPPAPQTRPPGTDIVIGCDVIVNGRLHRDSYGSAPGQTRTNYRGKVNFTANGRSHPFHVTDPNGGWLGWVTASSVQRV